MPILRAIECFVLFVALPGGLAMLPWRVNPIVLLLAAAAVVLMWLLIDPHFDRRRLIRFPDPKRNLIAVLWPLPLAAGMLALLLWWVRPETLLSLPRRDPRLWALVMCLYPLLSVIPQTLIYRVFFMHRYDALFGRGWRLVIAATLAFGFCHIVFRHPLPVAITTIGGLLFAWRYWKTRSAPISALEHALYGDIAFTLGYGAYLYHGSIEMIETTTR
jgi:hypothetical protein